MKQLPLKSLATNNFEIKNQDTVKALGLSWNPESDSFCFKINHNFSDKITKSGVLSDAAKLFDTLGWLAPTAILAKITFQKLWREELNWTDSLPQPLSEEWITYRNELKEIEQISIPRWYNCRPTVSIELHSFCVASQQASAAAIYIQVTSRNNTVDVSLIQAKTKVAPLKVVTIPKLELRAAALAAKLTNKVQSNIGLNIQKITFWTDSSTVLNWTKFQSSLLLVYEANRVSQIQRLTNVIDWKYISTKDNPTDCATRGLLPIDLRKHSL